MTLGDTILGALLQDRLVDWGLLLYEVVEKLIALVRKEKPTMVCPYMFHLYKEQQVLLPPELAAYILGMEMVKYNCTPNPDSIPIVSKSKTDQHQDTLTSEGWIKQKISLK